MVPALRRKLQSRTLLMFAAVLLSAGVAVACVAELGSPTPIAPTRSMMIGTWRSASGAELTLRSDGTFTARSLPNDFGGFLSGVPTHGSGVWHVTLTAPPGVVFDFLSGVSKAEEELFVERYRSAVILYYDKGDPDQGVTGQYQFTKLRPG
jgi:hypothetical protein